MNNSELSEKSKQDTEEQQIDNINDQELVRLYNDASDLENQCFKMLFDVRMKKNRLLSEMISRSKKNNETG